MKNILLIAFYLLSFGWIQAQTTQYNGNWVLCKVVTPKGDTQLVSTTDARYITYNFTYNNTFTSFRKEKNEEASGRWGFEFKTKTIKIKNPVYTKTRTQIGDYDLVISQVTPNFFVEVKEEKKKVFSYYIYCRVK